MVKGNKYGTHRVIEPKGTLPQPALKISNDTNIFDNEILIDVDYNPSYYNYVCINIIKNIIL